eukprot:CAMPEP_0116899072 /NCGR_PEP_ID=MMETSP0467-20121206/7709_1 /TAXON_ID=283647 /ORGANISM="Mesodinium pulex, Strain SPMC105" /LENGTH=61 /DNA_ID=CAMNT_0004571663 /DNA_START=243 /DNA_END=428 /DNA_ORIENTATION=+
MAHCSSNVEEEQVVEAPKTDQTDTLHSESTWIHHAKQSTYKITLEELEQEMEFERQSRITG